MYIYEITDEGFYWIQTTYCGTTFTDMIRVDWRFEEGKFRHKSDNESNKEYSAYIDSILELQYYPCTNKTEWKPIKHLWLNRAIKIEEPEWINND